jgi:hypothetical protein
MRIEEIRVTLATRLRARRVEIERTALTRIHAVTDTNENPDPEYTEGLRVAVSAALEYGIEAIERSEGHPPPIPTVLLSQARLAARHGIALPTVLRRYLAGYTLLGDFLIAESERGDGLDGASLKRLLRIQAALLDRLIAAVSEEYGRELQSRPSSARQRRYQSVERLLAGELLDTSELAYEFEANHLALIASGPGAGEALDELAKALSLRPLLVCPGEGSTWAWLGTHREDDFEQISTLLCESWPAHLVLALGQPGPGIEGWRLSHRQARAALAVARRSPKAFVRYVDVAFLASMLQDELLATSLRRLYLEPLEVERDGGQMARETLRAYFEARRNVSSTAAALGVSRRTVDNRIRAIEERLGCEIDAGAAELEAVLQLEELQEPSTAIGVGSPR